jgi:nicotinamide mononucleotide transporter
VRFVEAAAVVLTLLSVIFQIYENIWAWPTTIAGVALYSILFFHERLYADMCLQAVYIALAVYGWYEWLHGGEAKTERKVSNASLRMQTIAYTIGAVSAVILGFTFKYNTNAALPFLDSTLTSFSLVAQWMLTRKYLENWIVWIAVDVVYVGMFIFKHLYMTAGLYVVFIGLCARGYFEWKKSRTSREVVEAAGP